MKFISIESSLLALCLLNLSQAYDLKALAEYYNPGSGNQTITTATTSATATASAALTTSSQVATTTQAPTASTTTIVNPTTAPTATGVKPVTTTITPPIYANPTHNPTTAEQIKPTTTAPPNDYYQTPQVNSNIPPIPNPSETEKPSNLEDMPIGIPSEEAHSNVGNQESTGNHQSSNYPSKNDYYRPPPKHQQNQPNYTPNNTPNNSNQSKQSNYQPTNNQKFNWDDFKNGFQSFVSEFKQEYSDYQKSLNTPKQGYSVPVYNNVGGYTNEYSYNNNNNNGYNYNVNANVNSNTNANIYNRNNNNNNFDYYQPNNYGYF